MKGIILAAGKGTRLYPMTKPVCKPLVQYVARGIADAFLVAEDFVQGDSACLILGDNIFYAKDLREKLMQAASNPNGATVFGYYVDDPRAFGVVEFDEDGKAISLEEKPKHPKSNYIIPGLYFYDAEVLALAKTLQPSARGELEITDLNRLYLESGKLQVIPLESDFVWMDAGTADSLLESAQTIKQIQDDTGRYVACLEEIAYRHGYLSEAQVNQAGKTLQSTLYGQYLQCISAE